MKKVLSLVIVAGLFSAFLVGCSSPAKEEGAAPATTEGGTTAGATPAAATGAEGAEAPATK